MKLARAAAVVVVTGYLGVAAGGAVAQPDGGLDDRRCGSAASEMPGFGGAYVAQRETDGAPVLYVWMSTPDVAPSDAALTALRQHCPAYEDVVVREGLYSYVQLNAWERVAWTADAVTVTWVDTKSNRLTVGVADLAADGKAVQDALAQRGVPVDAVLLLEMSEPRTLLPPVDHSRSSALAAAVVVAVAGVAGVFWLRRLRRATRVR